MSSMRGMPKVGRKYARKITRCESELTGLPRWVEIYTSPATGQTAFKNCDITGGAKSVKAARKALSNFWSA